MGRGDHPAHAQHLAGVVRAVLFPDGYRHHRVHRAGSGGDHPAYHQAAAADARDDRHAAPGPRNPAALRGRPPADFPGDHAVVPRERRQPHWLPGPVDRSDAHSDRPVPGVDPHPVQQPAGYCKAFRALVPVDYFCADPFGGAGQQHLPLARSQPAGPVAHRHANPGGRYHLGAAENDADAVSGPASTVQPNDDVVDDAHFPGSILPGLAQRTSPLLGGFQPHRHRDPVFHHRLGALVPAVPTTRSGCGRRRDPRGSDPGLRPAGE